MAYTIRLKDYAHVKEEFPASAAITPGNFITVAAAGTVSRVTADYAGVKMVAVEDEFQGKTISDDYAADDIVQCWIPQPGDMVNAIAGAAVVAGALLATNAVGRVITATGAAGTVIGEATEAAAADGDRIAIRIK